MRTPTAEQHPRTMNEGADMSMSIRNVTTADAAAICAIYNPFVLETCVSFESEALLPATMAARIEEVSAQYPWLVAEDERGVAGYAYANRWRARDAYARTVETTIYLRGDCTGAGIGRALYRALLDELRRRGFHIALGCIALPNPQSENFHERCGFEKVAHFAQVGRKFDQWIDVGFWQIRL